MVEEQEREELRERHQAYLTLQKLQLEREIAEEAYRKEQLETQRIHALREQRAREVVFF
jgi:hypothetical protein